MAEEGKLDKLRTVAFVSVLTQAFSSFPKRTLDILREEGWSRFTDFMGAVARSGKVLFQFGDKPTKKAIEEKGVDTAIKEAYEEANTNAMNELFSGSFFGTREGRADRSLSAKALKKYFGVDTWNDFSTLIQAIATEIYKEENEGKMPFDLAKPETKLFFGLGANNSNEVIIELIKAFGLPTTDHLNALLDTTMAGDVTPEDLDRSIGNPEYLTEVIRRAPSNIRKHLVFRPVEGPITLGYNEVAI